MSYGMRFGEIAATVFLRDCRGGLEQLVRVGIVNDGGAVGSADIRLELP